MFLKLELVVENDTEEFVGRRGRNFVLIVNSDPGWGVFNAPFSSFLVDDFKHLQWITTILDKEGTKIGVPKI